MNQKGIKSRGIQFRGFFFHEREQKSELSGLEWVALPFALWLLGVSLRRGRQVESGRVGSEGKNSGLWWWLQRVFSVVDGVRGLVLSLRGHARVWVRSGRPCIWPVSTEGRDSVVRPHHTGQLPSIGAPQSFWAVVRWGPPGLRECHNTFCQCFWLCQGRATAGTTASVLAVETIKNQLKFHWEKASTKKIVPPIVKWKLHDRSKWQKKYFITLLT